MGWRGLKVDNSHPAKVLNWMDFHLCVLFFSKADLADSKFLHFYNCLFSWGKKTGIIETE